MVNRALQTSSSGAVTSSSSAAPRPRKTLSFTMARAPRARLSFDDRTDGTWIALQPSGDASSLDVYRVLGTAHRVLIPSARSIMRDGKEVEDDRVNRTKSTLHAQIFDDRLSSRVATLSVLIASIADVGYEHSAHRAAYTTITYQPNLPRRVRTRSVRPCRPADGDDSSELGGSDSSDLLPLEALFTVPSRARGGGTRPRNGRILVPTAVLMASLESFDEKDTVLLLEVFHEAVLFILAFPGTL